MLRSGYGDSLVNSLGSHLPPIPKSKSTYIGSERPKSRRLTLISPSSLCPNTVPYRTKFMIDKNLSWQLEPRGFGSSQIANAPPIEAVLHHPNLNSITPLQCCKRPCRKSQVRLLDVIQPLRTSAEASPRRFIHHQFEIPTRSFCQNEMPSLYSVVHSQI